MRHYRKEMEIRSELNRIGRDIEADRGISWDDCAFLSAHQAEVLRTGDIVLAEAACIEEEVYHNYMRTHAHAD